MKLDHLKVKALYCSFVLVLCSCTYGDCVFVASRHFNFILVNLQDKAPHPDCLARVSFLVSGCQFEARESPTRQRVLPVLAPADGGGHPQSTGALELKRYTTKRQEVPITSDHAQSLRAGQAEVQAVVLLAVLLGATGRQLTVHAVVRAVAVAALLALPVCPERLVSGQLAIVTHAAAVAAGHAEAVPHRKAVLALTPLLAWQRARLIGLIQVGAGQRAGRRAFLEMTVLWTRKG